MAMEGVLDGVRRAIHKWVNTTSPITANVDIGDTLITVSTTNRFATGDTVMLGNAAGYETGLSVASVVDDVTVELETPVLNSWTVDGTNTVLIKAVNDLFVRAIYIGDPEVIPMYPAITVNGVSRSSEWLTLESTTERYELEINVFVRDSSHEEGYRFLLKLTDLIQRGLKANITPLVSDYTVTSLTEDADDGDIVIRINDRDLIEVLPSRIILEDQFDHQENWVTRVYDENPTDETAAIQLFDSVCKTFTQADTTVIVPKRFIYNSWPHEINYGKIHKGELLKASTIRWFAQEEEPQLFRKEELKLN
tara:strand:+ start:1904 stop:2827 length:924 start_codon:yes stop_codon:yes gene_type:complete